MKKNVILAAVLMLICAQNMLAQESTKVNSRVVRNFEAKFPGASDVQWQAQPKEIALAQFHVENETWVAYYSPEGNLIMSGRKIKPIHQLPIKVQESLARVQTRYEEKFGALLYGSIFEMTSNKGTEYYIPLENNTLSMMVSIDFNGNADILKKDQLASPSKIDPTVIAKKN